MQRTLNSHNAQAMELYWNDPPTCLTAASSQPFQQTNIYIAPEELWPGLHFWKLSVSADVISYFDRSWTIQSCRPWTVDHNIYTTFDMHTSGRALLQTRKLWDTCLVGKYCRCPPGKPYADLWSHQGQSCVASGKSLWRPQDTTSCWPPAASITDTAAYSTAANLGGWGFGMFYDVGIVRDS